MSLGYQINMINMGELVIIQNVAAQENLLRQNTQKRNVVIPRASSWPTPMYAL